MNTKIHFEIGETIATILADDSDIGIIESAILDARSIIENKIRSDPLFGRTFYPYPDSAEDCTLIRSMCKASTCACVGPMASVAGAVLSHTLETVIDTRTGNIIIDNGGDIAFISTKTVYISMNSNNPYIDDIVFEILPHPGIYSVCSSSGHMGHSISLGNSDISTVFSMDPILADACATALGNLIQSQEDLASATELISSIDGIDGCLAACDGRVSICGCMPRIVSRKNCDDDKITRISLPCNARHEPFFDI